MDVAVHHPGLQLLRLDRSTSPITYRPAGQSTPSPALSAAPPSSSKCNGAPWCEQRKISSEVWPSSSWSPAMFERSPEERQFIKQAHWRTVLEGRWHPERSLAVLQDIHFSTQEWIDLPASPPQRCPKPPSSSTPSAATPPAMPTPCPSRCSSATPATSSRCSTQPGTSSAISSSPSSTPPPPTAGQPPPHHHRPRPRLRAGHPGVPHHHSARRHRAHPPQPADPGRATTVPGHRPPTTRRTAPTSYPALLLLLPLDHPTTVRLPSLSLSEPVYVSLMNPDLSMMTTSQLVELTELRTAPTISPTRSTTHFAK